jgi:hypothetical protein
MRKALVFFFFFGLSMNNFAQLYTSEPTDNNKNFESAEKKNSLTFGILEGGGGLLGIDYEALLSQQVGIQIGAGFVSFGAGLNYHFKPGIRSSYLSLQ